MSTLPEITEALCQRIAKADYMGARAVAAQAAAKMGGDRGERIRRAFDRPAMMPLALKHWATVREARAPWTPAHVTAAVEAWLVEVRHADLLIAAGERVMPLMLLGETRCGKTSFLCSVAAQLGLDVHRLSLASVVDSHMGETARKMRAALAEATTAPPALWLIDEIDGVTAQRAGGTSADAERAHAVAVLLVELESLPPHMILAATSNTEGLIDAAVLARFRTVRFPAWAELAEAERQAFSASHGAPGVGGDSYSAVVGAARADRVARIIATEAA